MFELLKNGWTTIVIEYDRIIPYPKTDWSEDTAISEIYHLLLKHVPFQAMVNSHTAINDIYSRDWSRIEIPVSWANQLLNVDEYVILSQVLNAHTVPFFTIASYLCALENPEVETISRLVAPIVLYDELLRCHYTDLVYNESMYRLY